VNKITKIFKSYILLFILFVFFTVSVKNLSAQSCSFYSYACNVDNDCCFAGLCNNGRCEPSSNIILNEGIGVSCYDLCWLNGFRGIENYFCQSVGTNAEANNGMSYVDNCQETNVNTCTHGILTSSFNNLCNGYRTNWTYCNCVGYVPLPILTVTPTSTPTPTSIPIITPTSTPQPSGVPAPFLDLPWDYQSKGMSFSDSALAINSYFDHEYPLLSVGLNDTVGVTNFNGFPSRFDISYSSHDGYDYGKSRAYVYLNDPVLAAASGCASYIHTDAGGNEILIDHGNYYQTRYYHLQPDGLITKSSSCSQVTKGHRIGYVGFSGNVRPAGELGSHIHFMVVQDKNKDENFDDNIPDGITDPFGWQSKETDPWPNYNFFYNGQQRTGNKSYYLWTQAIDNLREDLDSNTKFFEIGRYSLDFPQGSTDENLTLDLHGAPSVGTSSLKPIGSNLFITAKDSLGNLVTTLFNYFILSISFNPFDLSSYKTDTVSIYSSNDGINWSKENTNVDLNSKVATAQINHFSYFALMAERLDTTPPTTTVNISGDIGGEGWYKSDVNIILIPQDEGGLGVDYTPYKINESDWMEYIEPFTVSEEGGYKIEFYSVDNDENIEEVKSVEFSIDKTLPVITATKTPDANGWNNSDVTVHFDCTDSGSGVYEVTGDIVLATEAANQSVTGACTDKAGNVSEITVTGINIDKTPPVLTGTKSPLPNSNGWNNSDVTVHFDCTDSLSGVDTVSNDSIISSSGQNQSIDGVCTDKAGNTSNSTISEINIDKTQPELKIQFNPDKKSIDLLGIDDNETQVKVTNLLLKQKILVSDKAGNVTEVVGNKIKLGTLNTFSFKSIKYNNGETLSFDKNLFTALYLLKKDKSYYSINQIWAVKDNDVVWFNYRTDSNKTSIFTKETGIRDPKEIIDGLMLLFIKTDNGNLVYGY